MKKTILAANLAMAAIGCNFANADNINTPKKPVKPSDKKISWTGCYKQKSYLCTSPQDGSNCDNKFSDTLKITRKDSTYIAQLYSTQANQNTCAFKFEMYEHDGSLIHETEFGKVSITLKREQIEISSKGVDPTAIGLGICGVHADINELKFNTSSKSKNKLDCTNTEEDEQ